MTEKQLGAATSGATDTATKSYVDAVTPTFDALSTQGSAVLPAGLDLIAAGALEIKATDILEIPATSTLEIPYWVSTPLFQGAATAFVATSESTSSGSYGDLTTTTDSVTVTIGPSRMALVMITGCMSAASADGTEMLTSFAMSGANTLSASDTYALSISNRGGIGGNSVFFLLMPNELLSTGITTFKLKYRCTGGTMGMSNRRLSVIPL